MDVRLTKGGIPGQLEVLVKWKGISWEDHDTLRDQFPNFHLEDKVRLLGQGIDTPLVRPIRFTYARRVKS